MMKRKNINCNKSYLWLLQALFRLSGWNPGEMDYRVESKRGGLWNKQGLPSGLEISQLHFLFHGLQDLWYFIVIFVSLLILSSLNGVIKKSKWFGIKPPIVRLSENIGYVFFLLSNVCISVNFNVTSFVSATS